MCLGFLIILIAEICLQCPSLVSDDWVQIWEVRTPESLDMLGGTLLYDVIGEVSALLVYLPISLSPQGIGKNFKFVLKLCFLINCKYFKYKFCWKLPVH